MAIETSFLLIESGWSCERVYRLVDGVPTRWVVIQRSVIVDAVLAPPERASER